jgi:hypothetical protein
MLDVGSPSATEWGDGSRPSIRRPVFVMVGGAAAMAGGIRVSADEYAAVEAAVRQSEVWAGGTEPQDEALEDDDFDPDGEDDDEDTEDDESEEDDGAEEPPSSRPSKKPAAAPPSRSGVLHADRMERYLRQFLEEGNQDALARLQADKVGSKLLGSVNKALAAKQQEQAGITAKGMAWYYNQLDEQNRDYGSWHEKAKRNPQLAARFAEYAKFTEDLSSAAIATAQPKAPSVTSALTKHHDKLIDRYDGKLTDEEMETLSPDLFADMDLADGLVAMSEAAEKLWKRKQKAKLAKPLRQREAALSAPARAAAAAARTAPPARIPQGKGSQTIDRERFLAAWRENPTDPRLNRIYREQFSGGR